MTRNTTHTTHFKSAIDGLKTQPPNSVNLVVTSPPYPMVEMWDDLFKSCDPAIKNAIENDNWDTAHTEMHTYLNQIWDQLIKVTKEHGIIAINIGNATRRTNDSFQLFPNASPIINYFTNNGCELLPYIHWNKASNKSSSFMGSGMLPTNAYVTNDHEYILLFRVGTGTRSFPPKDDDRYESAYFWEERNTWFSDRWTVNGTTQQLTDTNTRDRSGAYPPEIPYRIINMYSIKGDTILDPFLGTGTTQLVAAALGRNSIGYEIDAGLKQTIQQTITHAKDWGQNKIKNRITEHKQYISTADFSFPYDGEYGPVKTKRETNLQFDVPTTITQTVDTDTKITLTVSLKRY